MSKKLIIGVAVVCLLLGAFCIYKLYGNKEQGITATGTIEITRYDLAPKTGGYIDQLSIKEGDKVAVGQEIAIVSRPDLVAQKLRDEAALSKAQLQLIDLEKGARAQEQREAANTVASTQAVYDRAKADYGRYQQLHTQGAISTQQLDSARSAYEVAKNEHLAAQARASLVDEGNRADVIAAQRQEVERSKAVVKLAQTMIDDTVVKSPAAGLVLAKNYEPGEYVNAGAAIATIGDWQDCWVKIYVSSTQLGLINVGQQVAVKVDSFPGKVFDGTIKEISQNAEFTPRQSITQNERANLVFAVKVKIANPDGVLKPGMPADVVIK